MSKEFKSKVEFKIIIFPTWANCSKEDLIKVFNKLPIPKGDFMQDRAYFTLEDPIYSSKDLQLNGKVETNLNGSQIDRLVMGITQKVMRFVQKRGFQFSITFKYT